MKKIFLYILLFCAFIARTQVTLSNGNHVLEITGALSTYYNYRDYKPTSSNFRKNRFKLRDAQIQLEGRIGHDWEYELQVDFADFANSEEAVDPENPGIMDANITYKGIDFVDVQVGYGKLYYSRNSLTPFIYSAYWQRAQINRDLWARRDVGVTLKKDFLNQRMNVYAGVYTGLGELSLNGDNDDSGKLIYAGRVDFAYPSRYRYREIDDKISPVPMFAVGLNGRYANKILPTGRVFPEFSQGEYGMRVVNGEQYIYGFDVAAQYMGFSAMLEMHQTRATPVLPTDPLLQGLPISQTEGFMKAGGMVAQLNYFSKSWKTIFSCRYEEMNISDLIAGKSKRFSPAIAYQINGFNAMIKAQYFGVINEDPLDSLNWNEQFRIGLQFVFK